MVLAVSIARSFSPLLGAWQPWMTPLGSRSQREPHHDPRTATIRAPEELRPARAFLSGGLR